MPKALSYLPILSLLFGLAGCATPSANPVSIKSSADNAEKTLTLTSAQHAMRSEPNSAPVPNTGYLARPEVQTYARAVAQSRNLPPNEVRALLASAQTLPVAIRLMSPPDPAKPRPPKNWASYRNNFIEPIRIRGGKAFMAEHATALAQAEQRYGVPGNIIAAIIGVETLYGQYMGNYRVLDALTTLSFDYPDPNRPDRIEMFQGQLADFIELHHQGKVDANRQLGSFAGAMGIPQFMPTSIKRWAVASTTDQPTIDLENNVNDAIASVANFLVEHGWIGGLPVFAPVDLPPTSGTLVDGGLTPTLDWAALQAAGATLKPGAKAGVWANYPLGVINLPLPQQNTVQYRTATPNFFALTQYNRSYFYATAVADLASAID